MRLDVLRTVEHNLARLLGQTLQKIDLVVLGVKVEEEGPALLEDLDRRVLHVEGPGNCDRNRA